MRLNPRRVAQRYTAATTPKDVHALADKLDISWDNDPGFMSWTKKVIGKEHLDDMSEKELRDVMSAMKSDPPKKTAKKNYSLPDFQRAAKEADKAVTDAYLSAHSLKAMWDTFEEIPPKQRRIYDNNMKVISLLGKARDESYQDYMDLKRYR